MLIEAEGVIVEAAYLNTFEKALQDVDQDTLVLFDVDHTLIVPKDLVLRSYSREVWDKFANSILKVIHPEKYPEGFLLSKTLAKIEYGLVNPDVVQLIQTLQQKGIKTIAFTKMFTGTLGVIPSMEDWRIAQLKEVNLDFSNAFPHLQQVTFETEAKTALFKNGVLCANNQNKGPVLVAFLKQIDWKPKKVLFLDDRLSYLQSVDTALSQTDIQFIGYHYRESENNPCCVDEKLAEFQVTHLAKAGEWLSDSEASERMRE